MKKNLQILNTTAFKSLGITVPLDGDCILTLGPTIPSPSVALNSDEYWSCFAQKYAAVGHHDCGTCRMGYGIADKNSVVDTNFR